MPSSAPTIYIYRQYFYYKARQVNMQVILRDVAEVAEVDVVTVEGGHISYDVLLLLS